MLPSDSKTNDNGTYGGERDTAFHLCDRDSIRAPVLELHVIAPSQKEMGHETSQTPRELVDRFDRYGNGARAHKNLKRSDPRKDERGACSISPVIYDNTDCRGGNLLRPIQDLRQTYPYRFRILHTGI